MLARLIAALAVAATLLGSGTAAADGALDRIRQTQAIRIAYREDAPPFSFKNSLGEPAGLIVDLCRAVADGVRQQLGLSTMKVVYVPVLATNRFDAIVQNRADLLCEPTTATLSRREQVDFSIPTFVDGASLLIRQDSGIDLHAPKALDGKKIGFLAGTTTEQEVRQALKEADMTAQLMPAKTHTDGLAMLDDGKIDAYFADRSILLALLLASKAPDKLMLPDRYYSIEPYALALPHGDEAFRLAVDRALSHVYRSGEVREIFRRSLPDKIEMGPMVAVLYMISGLPD